MYFSPLTPTPNNGTPAEDIHYVHLNIKRSGEWISKKWYVEMKALIACFLAGK